MRTKSPGRRSRGAPGFTWLETTIIIVIAGVLAAAAFPEFWRNIRRAKTAEAEHRLAVIHRSAVSYFVAAKVNKTGDGENEPEEAEDLGDEAKRPGDTKGDAKATGESGEAEDGAKATVSRFPDDVGPSPGDCTLCAQQKGGRCVPGPKGQGTYIAADVWDHPSWKALGFAIDHPHHFVYEFKSVTSDHERGMGSNFTARARADLDNDGICSTYERVGVVKSDGSFDSLRGVMHEMATE